MYIFIDNETEKYDYGMSNINIYTNEVKMHLSQHATHRAIQRSIPVSVIEAIFDFGTDYAARGLTGLRLDRHALDLAADTLTAPEFDRLRRYAGVYLIAAGDRVVTVARASRRHIH